MKMFTLRYLFEVGCHFKSYNFNTNYIVSGIKLRGKGRGHALLPPTAKK